MGDATASLIRGEVVAVIRPSAARDELGEPVPGEPAVEVVGNVVVSPGATADLEASRPDGASVAYTLGFPKTFSKPLRGCEVEVRGERLRVVGDPRPYTAANVPGPWNYTAEVTRADG